MANKPKKYHTTNQVLDWSRQAVRRFRKRSGLKKFGDRLHEPYAQLKAAQEETREKHWLRQDAYADVDSADFELDNSARDLEADSKRYDRVHPGEGVFLKIIPEGALTPYIHGNMFKEPDKIELIVQRIEHLGESHPIYPHAAILRNLIAAVRTSILAYHQAVLEEKKARDDEQTIKDMLCNQFEEIYLDARKEFGRSLIEGMLPDIGGREQEPEPSDQPEDGKSVAP